MTIRSDPQTRLCDCKIAAKSMIDVLQQRTRYATAVQAVGGFRLTSEPYKRMSNPTEESPMNRILLAVLVMIAGAGTARAEDAPPQPTDNSLKLVLEQFGGEFPPGTTVEVRPDGSFKISRAATPAPAQPVAKGAAQEPATPKSAVPKSAAPKSAVPKGVQDHLTAITTKIREVVSADGFKSLPKEKAIEKIKEAFDAYLDANGEGLTAEEAGREAQRRQNELNDIDFEDIRTDLEAFEDTNAVIAGWEKVLEERFDVQSGAGSGESGGSGGSGGESETQRPPYRSHELFKNGNFCHRYDEKKPWRKTSRPYASALLNMFGRK